MPRNTIDGSTNRPSTPAKSKPSGFSAGSVATSGGRGGATQAPPRASSNIMSGGMGAATQAPNPDPHNWAGIAAAFEAAARNAAMSGGIGAAMGGSGGFEGGGGNAAPVQSEVPQAIMAPPQPPPPPPVFETAASIAPPVQLEAPQAIVNTAAGDPSQVAQQFNRLGIGGTFGDFERMRNARSPRSNLSVTPEMLRSLAQSRLAGA